MRSPNRVETLESICGGGRLFIDAERECPVKVPYRDCVNGSQSTLRTKIIEEEFMVSMSVGLPGVCGRHEFRLSSMFVYIKECL